MQRAIEGTVAVLLAIPILASCGGPQGPRVETSADREERGYDMAAEHYQMQKTFLADLYGGPEECVPQAKRESCARWGADLRRGWVAYQRALEDRSQRCSDYRCREGREAREIYRAERDTQTVADRSVAYREGYLAGYGAERDRYDAYGVVWVERIGRPMSCLLLPRECGEIDGRMAFMDGALEGREACASLDARCLADATASDGGRRAAYELGFEEAYRELLEVHARGASHDKESLAAYGVEIPGLPTDCREAARLCGRARGFLAAKRAVEEGRVPCARLDANCHDDREALAKTYGTLAERERALATATIARRERAGVATLGAQRDERERALRAEATAILAGLRDDRELCSSSFGEVRLVAKEAALAKWKALGPEEQEAIGSAAERAGEAPGALRLQVEKAEAALHRFVSRRCFAGL